MGGRRLVGRTGIVLGILLASFGCSSASGPASLTWQRPQPGAEVYGLLQLEVAAAEPIGALRFYLDLVDEAHFLGRAEQQQERVFRLDWLTSAVPNGEHLLIAVAEEDEQQPATLTLKVANLDRRQAIPGEAPKMSPDLDAHPPRLAPAFSARWLDPVPLGAPVNTAGAEDSPFITLDGEHLYFFFTPDVSIEPAQQLTDRVSGIYHAARDADGWGEPERVYLSYYDELALDGAPSLWQQTMWFASARAAGRGLDIYQATFANGRWDHWQLLDQRLNLELAIGEMHWSPDGSTLYYDSRRPGGQGGKDLWMSTRQGSGWGDPQNLAILNSAADEGWPYLSADGAELWFTRVGSGAPEIYVSQWVAGAWSAPELVLSSFAGENTLDAEGNLYFVHHYWDDATNAMIEADIYVCYAR